MKAILITWTLVLSLSVFAQNTGGGVGGIGGGPRPIDDTRTLLEVLRNRNNDPRLSNTIPNDLYNGGVRTGGSGGTIGPKPGDDSRTSTNGGGGFGGGVSPRPTTNSATNSDLGALAGQVTQDQIRAFKTEVDAFNSRTANKGDEEVLPTRLRIESINLSSDEVTEITLKDGSVVKVEDLQEFVRQKMKEKLNQ